METGDGRKDGTKFIPHLPEYTQEVVEDLTRRKKIQERD
jgi:hypothetical protein